MLWDRWSLTDGQVEALLRGVEQVAVEAAFDPAAPTRVLASPTRDHDFRGPIAPPKS
jgi:hypothetical protein